MTGDNNPGGTGFTNVMSALVPSEKKSMALGRKKERCQR